MEWSHSLTEETVVTCDLATVSTAQQELDKVPEVLANSKSLVILVQMEPQSEEGAPSVWIPRETGGVVIPG